MNNQFLYDWSIYPVPLDNPNAAPFQPLTGPFEQQDRPTFYRGEFSVDDIGDTFIRLDGWGKGLSGSMASTWGVTGNKDRKRALPAWTPAEAGPQ